MSAITTLLDSINKGYDKYKYEQKKSDAVSKMCKLLSLQNSSEFSIDIFKEYITELPNIFIDRDVIGGHTKHHSLLFYMLVECKSQEILNVIFELFNIHESLIRSHENIYITEILLNKYISNENKIMLIKKIISDTFDLCSFMYSPKFLNILYESGCEYIICG